MGTSERKRLEVPVRTNLVIWFSSLQISSAITLNFLCSLAIGEHNVWPLHCYKEVRQLLEASLKPTFLHSGLEHTVAPSGFLHYILVQDGKRAEAYIAGLASKFAGRAFLSGVMRPEHRWRTTFVYSVFSSHSTMTVSSANLLEIKCWKNVKTILCCRRLLRKRVYSFVGSKRKSFLTAFDYLETDYPRGKLKRKTMSPLQESPECNLTTAMAGERGSCPSALAGLVQSH